MEMRCGAWQQSVESRNAVKFPSSVNSLVRVDDHEFIKLSTYLTDHL